jgi:hypothetical protein
MEGYQNADSETNNRIFLAERKAAPTPAPREHTIRLFDRFTSTPSLHSRVPSACAQISCLNDKIQLIFQANMPAKHVGEKTRPIQTRS